MKPKRTPKSLSVREAGFKARAGQRMKPVKPQRFGYEAKRVLKEIWDDAKKGRRNPVAGTDNPERWFTKKFLNLPMRQQEMRLGALRENLQHITERIIGHKDADKLDSKKLVKTRKLVDGITNEINELFTPEYLSLIDSYTFGDRLRNNIGANWHFSVHQLQKLL